MLQITNSVFVNELVYLYHGSKENEIKHIHFHGSSVDVMPILPKLLRRKNVINFQ